jgi:large subunit ribosomal protein L35
MKTHKGLLKRLRVGGTGTITRRKAGKSHLMTTKSSQRRRRLSRTAVVPRSQLKRIRRMLGL